MKIVIKNGRVINPASKFDSVCDVAISAGRVAWESGLMEMRDMAAPSTPVAGTPFFDLGKKG